MAEQILLPALASALNKAFGHAVYDGAAAAVLLGILAYPCSSVGMSLSVATVTSVAVLVALSITAVSPTSSMRKQTMTRLGLLGVDFVAQCAMLLVLRHGLWAASTSFLTMRSHSGTIMHERLDTAVRFSIRNATGMAFCFVLAYRRQFAGFGTLQTALPGTWKQVSGPVGASASPTPNNSKTSAAAGTAGADGTQARHWQIPGVQPLVDWAVNLVLFPMWQWLESVAFSAVLSPFLAFLSSLSASAGSAAAAGRAPLRVLLMEFLLSTQSCLLTMAVLAVSMMLTTSQSIQLREIWPSLWETLCCCLIHSALLVLARALVNRAVDSVTWSGDAFIAALRVCTSRSLQRYMLEYAFSDSHRQQDVGQEIPYVYPSWAAAEVAGSRQLAYGRHGMSTSTLFGTVSGIATRSNNVVQRWRRRFVQGHTAAELLHVGLTPATAGSTGQTVAAAAGHGFDSSVCSDSGLMLMMRDKALTGTVSSLFDGLPAVESPGQEAVTISGQDGLRYTVSCKGGCADSACPRSTEVGMCRSLALPKSVPKPSGDKWFMQMASLTAIVDSCSIAMLLAADPSRHDVLAVQVYGSPLNGKKATTDVLAPFNHALPLKPRHIIGIDAVPVEDLHQFQLSAAWLLFGEACKPSVMAASASPNAQHGSLTLRGLLADAALAVSLSSVTVYRHAVASASQLWRAIKGGSFDPWRRYMMGEPASASGATVIATLLHDARAVAASAHAMVDMQLAVANRQGAEAATSPLVAYCLASGLLASATLGCCPHYADSLKRDGIRQHSPSREQLLLQEAAIILADICTGADRPGKGTRLLVRNQSGTAAVVGHVPAHYYPPHAAVQAVLLASLRRLMAGLPAAEAGAIVAGAPSALVGGILRQCQPGSV